MRNMDELTSFLENKQKVFYPSPRHSTQFYKLLPLIYYPKPVLIFITERCGPTKVNKATTPNYI